MKFILAFAKSITVVSMVMLFVGILHNKVTAQANDPDINIKYDRFEDETLVTTKRLDFEDLMQSGIVNGKVQVVHPDSPFFQFSLYGQFSYKGQQKTANFDSVYIMFVTTSDYQRFARNTNLNIIADGERIPLGALTRLLEIERTYCDSCPKEKLFTSVSVKTLSKIANAKLVELRLGTIEFQLPDKHKEMLRKLIQSASPNAAK